MSGCVALLATHVSRPTMDCWKAHVRPAAGHCTMWPHVSSHANARQLGHDRSRLSWCVRSFIVPAIPSRCFDAHTWNSRGTECRVLWTDCQLTLSNPSVSRIFFCWKRAFDSCRGAWEQIWWPVLDKSLAPLTKMPIGSRGNKELSCCSLICWFVAWLGYHRCTSAGTSGWVCQRPPCHPGELSHGSNIRWMWERCNLWVYFWVSPSAFIVRESDIMHLSSLIPSPMTQPSMCVLCLCWPGGGGL